MPVFANDDLPVHAVPRISTRILVGKSSGAHETAVWEQWIRPDGFIPLHYHEVEEILVILTGSICLTLGDEDLVVSSPATILVPPRQIHGLRTAGDDDVHLLAFFPTADPTIISPEGTLRPMPWDDRATRSR